MKRNNTRTNFLSALSVAGLVSLSAWQAQAGDYYIYQQPDGKLVLSNNPPPEGSKIIKKQTLPESTDQQLVQSGAQQDQLGVDNRLANLEKSVGDLSNSLRAQSEAIGSLQQGGGDNNAAVGVTQAPGFVARAPRRNFVNPPPRNDIPGVQPRSQVPAAQQRRERAG
jgi:hypothetical protein